MATFTTSTLTAPPTLSEQLATWMAGVQWRDLPPEVQRAARLQILDVVGVMLAARPSDEVAAAARAMAVTDGGTQARALGFHAPLTVAGAAFVNGVMSSLLEFDDTHIASFVHPTVAPFSVALAWCLGQGPGNNGSPSAAGQGSAPRGRTPASGAALALAVALGSELGCRLGLVSPARLHSAGIHPTAVMGAFGAVYALACLQGLPPAQIVSAIGHCASMAAGGMASWVDGASTKTLHVGMAAAQAVRATALAAEGLTGPRGVFEGRYGWFTTHLQRVPPADFRYARATQGLGEVWEMLDVASKPYPSAFTIHPYVDAVLALRAAHGLDAARIVEMRCPVRASSVATLCEPVEEKLRPRTSWHGRISLQHSMAEAWVLGRMDKTAYAPEALADPRIRALADKVRYDTRDEWQPGTLGAQVEILLDDGTRVRHEILHMRGTRDNPFTEADYLAKFRANAGGVVPDAVIESTIDGLLHIDALDDVATLFDPLAS